MIGFCNKVGTGFQKSKQLELTYCAFIITREKYWTKIFKMTRFCMVFFVRSEIDNPTRKFSYTFLDQRLKITKQTSVAI